MIDNQTPLMGPEEQQRSAQRSRQRLRPPTQVPGYEPEAFLGQGAYGEVWLAHDLNIPRRVAIKFYNHRGGLDWSLLTREVEKLAFLFNDRYVVQVIEAGWDADPPYYVMEYLEGGSLEERLRGPLSLAEAEALFREVATALVHVHNRGVLHCDLKPANVLLDAEGRPRLADFGQARLLTEQTHTLGTLFYMAPEQADPKALPSARWDVYSLGALMYQVLTGQQPYRTEAIVAELEAASNLEERLQRYRHLLGAAPRPGAHRTVPGIDRALVEIVDHCLAAHPAKRFANVQGVLSALDARDLQRARRPLLLLGGLGPALILVVIACFAWAGLTVAVRDSNQALTERALDAKRLTAQGTANTVADEIDQRWRILERSAADPRLHDLLRLGADRPRSSPERRALQAWADEQYRNHCTGPTAVTTANSWIVLDAHGFLRASGPLRGNPANYLDKDFSYRDHFHGQEREYPPGTRGLNPLTRPHLSIVFQTKVNQTLRVACSVPIRARQPGSAVLGVLTMSVELGNFGELAAMNAGVESNRDSAVGPAQKSLVALVDLRADWRGREGLILQHPRLTALRQAHPDQELEAYRWQPEEPQLRAKLETLQRAGAWMTERRRRHVFEDSQVLGMTDSYQDPFGPEFAEYRGQWLAAFQPVLVQRDSGEVYNTRWLVIVQEPTEQVVGPIKVLEGKLVRGSLLSLVLILGVLLGLWLFVTRVLNAATPSRLLALLRIRTGLTPRSSGSGVGSSGAAPEPGRTGKASAPGTPTLAPMPRRGRE